ncbi:P-loop containing nucleoside triphosphate hydrolase protein [Lipomyces japonicus]|uniref:P-loop containing nucleoside triphosphate hydrolase protein n=1 Tax=Lipomyces japonicus TaxID=56871 RepID=UPI0034CF4258
MSQILQRRFLKTIIIVSSLLIATSLCSALKKFFHSSRQISLNSFGLLFPHEQTEGDEENPNYRLNTTVASTDNSSASETLVASIDIDNPLVSRRLVANRDNGPSDLNNDFDIVFLSSNGVRTKAAIEQVLLLGLIALNSVTFVILIFYHPREEGSHLSIAALVYIALWAYVSVIAFVKNLRTIVDPPCNFWVHTAVIYFFEWALSLVHIRSAYLYQYSALNKILSIVNFLFTSGLWVIALLSPIGRVPAYVEVRKNTKPNPEPYCSLLETLTLGWLDRIVFIAYKRPITMNDIWDVNLRFSATKIFKEFELLPKHNSFNFRVARYFAFDITVSTIWTICYASSIFAPTIFVNKILVYLENPERQPIHVAWFYVFLLFASVLIGAMFNLLSLWGFQRTCIRFREVIWTQLYNHALSRPYVTDFAKGEEESDGQSKKVKKNEKAGNNKLTNGAILNLMVVDTFLIADLVMKLQKLIKFVVMIIVSFILLYKILGVSAFAGMATMAALLPINYYIGLAFSSIQRKRMAASDKLIQHCNEIFQNIKIVKYLVWEDRYMSIINKLRGDVLKLLLRKAIIWSVGAVYWFGFSTIITLVTFGVYTLVAKNDLRPSVTFTSLMLFAMMRTPLDGLASLLSQTFEAKVSLNRLANFMEEAPTSKYEQISEPEEDAPKLGFQNASFSWNEGKTETTFKLQNINVNFEVGKFTIIAGPTGSGKTSLLMALLGEMPLLKGKVFLPCISNGSLPVVDPETGFSDSVAYCAQQAWLLNDSIRNNILFGTAYHERRYQRCVHACALIRDLDNLEYGDQTLIGEKGITLSGGQKQRISLCRALYSSAKHLILDDCLSAVDSHSALWIYDKCIRGSMMQNRTCILVTHNIALTLASADHVVVIKNGKIENQGTPKSVFESGILGDDPSILTVMSKSNLRNESTVASSAHFPKAAKKKLVALESARQGDNSFSTDTDDENDEVVADIEEELETLIRSKPAPNQEEIRQDGRVKLRVYKNYLLSMGGLKYWLLVLISLTFQQVVQLALTSWVRIWSNEVSQPEEEYEIKKIFHKSTYYFKIYAFLTLLYLLCAILRPMVTFWGSLRASKRLFNQLLVNVLRATPRFFDITPVGRIINRFSNDVQAVDQIIAMSVSSTIYSIISIITVLIIISFVIPQFLIAAVIVGVLSYFVVNLYVSFSIEIGRMNSINRSPLFQNFNETLNGVSTIRAFGVQSKFFTKNILHVENFTRTSSLRWALSVWLSLRIDIIGGIVSTSTAVFVIVKIGKIDSALSGLCLTYAIMYSSLMFSLVDTYTGLEMNMNAVERIEEYINVTPEMDAIIPDSRPPSGWPSKGAIDIQDLTLRYAPNLPIVISNVSFTVEPRSKIGVVGRTGAGKSTISSALFRFLEPENGRIKIDGVDISSIGLKDLRKGLTIIPQDPTLFIGTIRSNLDPFDKYTDCEVFLALKRVKLIDDIPSVTGAWSSLPLTAEQIQIREMNVFYKLDSLITEGGLNLSQGQRQLMCLARSLLTSPKIIVLDEATASIDYQTDAQIQVTIRQEFSDSTIITIAHRLRSIIDYDMILVLDDGKVIEYDKPFLLLQNKDSSFRAMCESSGELDILINLAENAYNNQLLL